MSIEINFPFTTPTNYVYDGDKVEISGGKAKLKEYTPAGQFTEDFADDTDFTYDSDKAEFSGDKLQQKNLTPADATLYASMLTDEDSNWCDGSDNNSLSGTAVWDAGWIDLTGKSGQLSVPGAGGNFNCGTVGCIRFKFKLNSVTASQSILETVGGGNANSIFITFSPNRLNIDIRDSNGSSHWMYSSGITFVQGQEYQFELNFDFDASGRLFIDGIQRGGIGLSSYTRNNITKTFLFSPYQGGNYHIKEIVFFSDVQHTSEHAGELPFSYPSYRYLETSITCPTLTYAGIENLQSFDSFSITENGAPKYILNDMYWTGSAWSASDGTYAQASSESDINTNIGTLTAANTLVVKVVFPALNTISDVDDLAINYTGQTYYTDNPTVEFNSSFRHENIDGFTETSTTPTNTNIKYILKKGSSWYYWNGSAWAVSDGTYAQANTAAEIETNKASFTDTGVVTYVKAFLNTTDVDATPELDNVQVLYDFSGVTTDEIDKCIVWGYNKDAEGNADTTAFKVYLNTDVVQYKDDLTLRKTEITVTPDSTGYWEAEIAETVNMTGRDDETVKYVFDFTRGNVFEKSVPNQESINYYDLT